MTQILKCSATLHGPITDRQRREIADMVLTLKTSRLIWLSATKTLKRSMWCGVALHRKEIREMSKGNASAISFMFAAHLLVCFGIH